MHLHQFLIARLDGGAIQKDIDRYMRYVRDGIAGFIVFGGELEEVREGLIRLQKEAKIPLVISSDLERGLGQQLSGGSNLPPARVIGRAFKRTPELVRKAYGLLAAEAAYAGINTVFAPLLDIDSNPLNPIISTRALGGDSDSVMGPALMMMGEFKKHGLTPCGKHFPGHGDTSVDSHLGLPVLDKSISELQANELVPFASAIKAGLPMMMTAHMSVPALDPTDTPMTLSKPAIDYLKGMGFKGLIATDALDMGALKKYGQASAALMALEAGVDILLHPSDPDEIAREFDSGGQEFICRLNDFRQTLNQGTSNTMPAQDTGMAYELTRLALKVNGDRPAKKPGAIVAITDDETSHGAKELARLLGIKAIIVNTPQGMIRTMPTQQDNILLTVSSDIRGYKGGRAGWTSGAIDSLMPQASAMVSFGPESLLALGDRQADGLSTVCAYWDSAHAGRAIYEEFFKP